MLDSGEFLHDFKRLLHICFGLKAAYGCSNLAIGRHNERRALGESVIDRNTARVFDPGAEPGRHGPNRQIVRPGNPAVCIGSHRDLSSAVIRISREGVESRNAVERHTDVCRVSSDEFIMFLGEFMRLDIAAAVFG